MSAIETAGTLIATEDLPRMQALTSAPSSPYLGTAARRGVLLGISADPSTEG